MNNAMRPVRFACALVCGLAPLSGALAQPGVVPVSPKFVPQPAQQAPAPTPAYDSLVKRDAAGKVIRVTGILDALAVLHNPSMDEAARARMEPVVAEWTADLNQVTIDNLDFVEQFEAGVLDSYDVNDMAKTQYVQRMNVQLSAAGPLSARLSQKNIFTGQAAGLNMQITNEYIQAVFNELNSATPPPAPNDPQGKIYGNAVAVNRFFTSLSSRDACEQYRRMLLDSAPLIDEILPTLPAPARVKAAPKVPAVKAASDALAKMAAVRDLLKELSFDDRRAFLAKAVALGAAADPFHPAPEWPTPAASAANPAAASDKSAAH